MHFCAKCGAEALRYFYAVQGGGVVAVVIIDIRPVFDSELLSFSAKTFGIEFQIIHRVFPVRIDSQTSQSGYFPS